VQTFSVKLGVSEFPEVQTPIPGFGVIASSYETASILCRVSSLTQVGCDRICGFEWGSLCAEGLLGDPLFVCVTTRHVAPALRFGGMPQGRMPKVNELLRTVFSFDYFVLIPQIVG